MDRPPFPLFRQVAVEAAGAALADAQIDFFASLRDELGVARRLPTMAELDAFARDPLIVERSRDAIERFGPGSHGFYNSGQLFLEEYYTLALVAEADCAGDTCPFSRTFDAKS